MKEGILLYSVCSIARASLGVKTRLLDSVRDWIAKRWVERFCRVEMSVRSWEGWLCDCKVMLVAVRFGSVSSIVVGG